MIGGSQECLLKNTNLYINYQKTIAMDRVSNLSKLKKGQEVVVIEESRQFSCNVYKFICNDVLSPERYVRDHYGLFLDVFGEPIMMYVHKTRGVPVYMNFTEEELLMYEKQYLEKRLESVKENLCISNGVDE